MKRGSFSFVATLESDSVQKIVFVQFCGSSEFGQRSNGQRSEKKCSFSFVVPRDLVNVQSSGVHSVLWPLLSWTAFRMPMCATVHVAVLQSTLVIQLCHSACVHTHTRTHTRTRKHTHVCYSARCGATEHICMYVCMHACMYVMYVCTYVCMYVFMYVCMYVC